VDLLSEGEQWEAVKAWLRQNGLAIIAGALIGVIALLGWRWWQNRQDTQGLAANAAYQRLLGTFDSGDVDGALKQLDALRKDYGDSAYAAPAQLAAARVHVARNELDKAAALLRSVADTSKDDQLKVVARLRLARVQIAQGKADDALATLGMADAGAFRSAFAEVRGDALLAKGDRAGALKAYEAARSGRGPGAQAAGAEGADLLDLKINDLSVAAPATAAAPKG
jgi:predicted negative regulator of RcsB-dependent stress response